MKKWILFSIFIFALQVTCKITPVLAESQKDTLAIEKVTGDYLSGIFNRDWDSVSELISANHSFIDREGKVYDFAGVKSIFEKIAGSLRGMYISDLKISNLNIQDNKATLEASFNLNGFDVNRAVDVSSPCRRQVSLVKKDDSWKVTLSQYETP